MGLSLQNLETIQRLTEQLVVTQAKDIRHSRYYEGLQRLAHMGIAVPPELRQFETVVNWCRTVVDTPQRRIKLRTFLDPEKNVTDEQTRAIWDANNLSSNSALLHKDVLIYGRGFVSVGTNPDDEKLPLVTIESPMELSVKINPRTRRIIEAFRPYAVGEDGEPTLGTLYLENETIWMERGLKGDWIETDRDQHNLGRVPLIMFLNKMRTGIYEGVSEMADVMGLVDAVARTVTNLQVAAETHAIPQKHVVGMSKGDFLDKDGKPLPVWESYFDAILATESKDAKFGQFTASDLSNFHNTVEFYGKMASSVSGLPSRYFGITSTNPSSYDAIRAEEVQLNNNVESLTETLGDGWSWVMDLCLRFITGDWDNGRRVKAEFFDPATPTISQRADALQKLSGGVAVITREGVWDELDWSEARKGRERDRFAAQESDPLLEKLANNIQKQPQPA